MAGEAGSDGVQKVHVRSAEITLSGLWRRPPGPLRGLVVALHGGGKSAGYWDCPSPGLSLLDLGAELGFAVLALDRPGYGASRDFDPNRLGMDGQADLVFGAIDAWRAAQSIEAPVFLIGHSVGAILALVMGGHRRGPELAAIDVLGAPFRYPATAAGADIQSMAPAGAPIPVVNETTRRAILFGPDGTWDEAAFAYDRTCAGAMPAAEYRDGIAAPSIWTGLLPTIRRPVRFGLAEFEVMQVTGWEALTEVKALLTGHDLSVVHLQRASGHNVSMHRVARAYHMAALAFFEQALAAA